MGNSSSKKKQHEKEAIPEPPFFVKAIATRETVESETELIFEKGEILEVINTADPDWWEAKLGSSVGFIPKSFVALTDEQPGTYTCVICLIYHQKYMPLHCLPTRQKIMMNYT